MKKEFIDKLDEVLDYLNENRKPGSYFVEQVYI